MLGNVDYIRRSLESVRDLVQQSSRAEIPREVQGKGPFEEEDTAMYDGPKQPAYGGTTEVKKRRGVRVRPLLNPSWLLCSNHHSPEHDLTSSPLTARCPSRPMS